MSDKQCQLVMQKGPEPGKIYELSAVNITIGRDPMADITITDPEVSRQHVRLSQSPLGYTIQDLGSTNGTFVDGQRLSGEAVELKHGQILSMGAGVSLRFEVEGIEQEEYYGRETVLDFSPSGTYSSFEVEPEISAEPVDQENIIEYQGEASALIDEPEQEFQISETEVPVEEASGDKFDEELEGEDQEISYVQEPNRFDDPPNLQEEPSEFVEPSADPVILPHEGQPDLEEPDGEKQRPWRMPAIIISVLLLILCCCCSLILFLYYYGGDWMLRQMGLVP